MNRTMTFVSSEGVLQGTDAVSSSLLLSLLNCAAKKEREKKRRRRRKKKITISLSDRHLLRVAQLTGPVVIRIVESDEKEGKTEKKKK